MCNLEMCDSVFSDHMSVLFEDDLILKSRASAQRRCIFNPSTAGIFSAAFDRQCVSP